MIVEKELGSLIHKRLNEIGIGVSDTSILDSFYFWSYFHDILSAGCMLIVDNRATLQLGSATLLSIDKMYPDIKEFVE